MKYNTDFVTGVTRAVVGTDWMLRNSVSYLGRYNYAPAARCPDHGFRLFGVLR